ncbi:unnamed protein product [Blepharisma stoltei]|uniref:Peptidase M14 domain-containing protein n=1 Tax=Blepharisma stoltei TaxID=1481888 RepID=A0AAU9K8L6_9CILI|nr:unnamed protein product [Blepharisma stoltei]
MKVMPITLRLNTEDISKNSDSSSTEDCLWSYGSPKETIRYDIDPNVYSYKENPKKRLNKLKTKHFRCEYDGILVYDSKARFADEPIVHKKTDSSFKSNTGFIHDGHLPLTSKLKKELKSAPLFDKEAYLNLKYYTPEPTWDCDYTLEVPADSFLRFNSKFESGNLRKAIRLAENEYNLILESDSERISSQWYYFSVKNKKPVTVKFNIINLGKYESLYNDGMLPLTKSKLNGNQWKRAGFNVAYYPNQHQIYEGSKTAENTDGKYYTLTFCYTFEKPGDKVYFCYSQPYSYQDLTNYLDKVKESSPNIARVDSLCSTIAGNACYMVTITENIESYIPFTEEMYSWDISDEARRLIKRRRSRVDKPSQLSTPLKSEHKHKKGIVITSRVHSGETVSSYMMKGFLDFLLGDSKEASILRSHYVFRLVPMLNPDGVRYGKTRSSLLGVDLNRRWLNPNKILHPTIFYTKKMLQSFSETHEVMLYCDLHGHSTKRNVFMYGCSIKSYESSDKRKNLLARMVPILMEKNQFFSYNDSRFKMEKSKESTARIVVFRQFKIINSYTIEASFYGPETLEPFEDDRISCHMEPFHYESLGVELAKVCLNFVSIKIFVKNLVYISTFLKEIETQKSDFSKHIVTKFFNPEAKQAPSSIEYPTIEDSDFQSDETFQEQIFDQEDLWNQILSEDICDDGMDSDSDSVESSQSAAEEFEVEIVVKKPKIKKKEKIKILENSLRTKPKKEQVTLLSKRRIPRPPIKSSQVEKNSNPGTVVNGYVVKFNFDEQSSRSHSSENIFKENLRKPGRLAAMSVIRNASPIQTEHLQGTGLMHLLRKQQVKTPELTLAPPEIEIKHRAYESNSQSFRRTVYSKSPVCITDICKK